MGSAAAAAIIMSRGGLISSGLPAALCLYLRLAHGATPLAGVVKGGAQAAVQLSQHSAFFS